MQEAIELVRLVFRIVIQEAHEKGVLAGALKAENDELRATIEMLEEKLARYESAQFDIKVRGLEITD